MINPKRKLTRAVAFAILFCFTSLTGAQPLYAIPPNTQLPVLDNSFDPIGGVTIPELNAIKDNIMNITQTDETSIIKWKDFSIGADAIVNFTRENGGTFNSLNFVNSGAVSEIYGQLTALGGNIFIANPAGVTIGNSAQINVGSLYVTNKDIEKAVDSLKGKDAEEIRETIAGLNTGTNAQLMSLGAITNATNVTFDGARIVLDTDRIYTANGDTGELEQVGQEWFDNLHIRTTDKDNVVLGYTKDNPHGVDFNNFGIKVVDNNDNVTDDKLNHGYTWIHDLAELQAMNDDPIGWYALRNSIDAYDTASMDDGKGFDPIGDSSQAFTGRFDGLGYSIFGLNIDKDGTKNIGLFGYAQNATIRNFTLNSSEIKGGANTGAVVGHADGGKIENVTNTGNVTGGDRTGGIVGKAENKVAMSGLINIGKVVGKTDTGGVVGSMSGGSLSGESYNLGGVTGGHNVGGIVGQAANGAQIGGGSFQIFNQLNVTGDYNVGGIAGTLSGGTITNAANHGNVTAEGHTTETYQYHKGNAEWINNVLYVYDNRLNTIDNVYTANAGGIAGKANDTSISNVTNTGDVTTSKTLDDTATGTYYNAGNVGGIVGRAEDTKITNAENKENTVAGAHNVGGVAGFLTGDSTVSIGVNNGGDITATGARTYGDFARETVRGVSGDGNENFIIGNIGGVVGYLFGDDAKIKNSGNRGTVHSAEITENSIPLTARAANVGGVAGKISSETNGTTEMLQKIKDGEETATVSNSYNTGDVRGYTGVGGVIGQMFNGSVSGSYNLGTLEATRTVDENSMQKESLNMGGIVGDTSEESKARAIIYDVYNAGQIGDENFYFRGRHVGGIAGRLSGFVDKAYNTGDIYNGYSTVGGIAGWWFAGKISNVFNTGNITVKNFDAENKRSQVGGIVGDAGADAKSLSYAYNLGTIRSFAPYLYDSKTGGNAYSHHVGGIAGRITNNLEIDNVYTLGNLYAASIDPDSNKYVSTTDTLGAIYGSGGALNNITNANYITPENPENTAQSKFEDLSEQAKAQGINVVEYDDKSNADAYELTATGVTANIEKLDTASNWSVNDGAWRLYDNGTPILNVFTPNMSATDAWKKQLEGTDATVQYGTAYNPMLTILNLEDASNKDVTFNWGDLGLYGAGGLAVYGGGLTIDGFQSAGDGRYFGGTIFSDHALAMNGTGTNFNLGSASKLYGSSVTLKANGGDISAYGEITSMNGDIEITGKNVEIIGSLTAKEEGEKTEIDGISGASRGKMDTTNLNDPDTPMKSVSDMFTYTTEEGSVSDGNITVNASGAAEVLYGNLGTGSVSTAGNFTVNGGTTDGGSVYVDSDLSGTTGNINLSAGGEVLLDITNIAKANENDKDPNGAGALHEFLTNHRNGNITLNSTNDDEIIAIDMWDGDGFNLDKYDYNNVEFGSMITALGNGLDKKTHIWVSDAEQLNGIQSYYDDKQGKTNILNYNFALKGNIDASALEDYKAIGGESVYSGTFDGRGFRIIGLNTNAADANNASSGIFGKLAGTVKDLRVYASKFFGGDGESAGAIASEVITQTKEDGSTVSGTITGVTTFGNTVTAEDGAAGGIAGENSGSILESTASDSVTASGANAYAGGVAGVNTGSIGEKGAEGESAQITADSAVRSGADGAAAIGGVVGKNETDGEVWLANSLGVTTGANAESTGGIAGTNSGEMTSLYNESIVMGKYNVGGVAGTNEGNMSNAVNATSVTADTTVDEDNNTAGNVGGLAGVNSGTIDSGRNAGVVTGGQNVGGIVGANNSYDKGETTGILKNLSNALAAVINGKKFVGGIAGSNSGAITGASNLVNEGKISGETYVGGIVGANSGTINGNEGGTDNGVGLTNKATVSGNKYVGGVAGQNTKGGTITNTNSDADLEATGNDAKYFGGVAGQNDGTIDGATNSGELIIGTKNEDNEIVGTADYVGGIVGHNTGDLNGILRNEGTVLGKDKVGGLAGENTNDQLLKGEESNRLIVTNTGDVTATDGSAGGIFYYNTGEIKYADLTNTGTVNGKETLDGGHGGLFGINTGTITYSTLTNGGTVEGGNNVGGLIGKNSGAVQYSSLKNEYGAIVSGIGSNVGGLIGYNTGEIIGGRIDDSGKDLGLYTYKIYNNGEVSGATNVGGLIGNNAVEGDKTGSLIAGYNTGVVTGSGKNVGGIAGTNAGTIDQVFNTIMTGVDNLGATLFGAVTGENNVGGIIGSNTGKLTNAYNTTGVTGTTNIGNIVGKNTDTVENVYATNETGTLVGDGNATDSYSFSEADNEKEGIIVIEPAAKNKQGSYEQFDFTGGSGTPAVWKIYEGKNGQEANGTPLLKVFLTNAEYSGETSFTYNGKNQGLSLDGVTVDEEKLSDVAKTLLSALEGKNAYNDYLGFTSEQIAGSTTMDGDGNVVFNPNNLGYDIDATFDIDKATLNISLNEVNRVYGNDSFTNGTNYGYTIDSTLTVEMEKELAALGFDKHYDKAVDGLADGRTTNDAGTYEWSADFTLEGDLAKNYEFAGSTGAQTTIGGGVSTVDKAKLTINVGDVSTTYGTAFDKNKYGYTLGGLVNGDSDGTLRDEIGGVEYTNDAALDGSNGKWTANAGDYENAVGIESVGELANYNIVAINKGDAHVGKADLTINVGDVSTTYGTAFDKSKYGYVLSGLANGDSDGTLRAEIGGVEYTNDAALDGSNGKWTANAGDYENAVGIDSIDSLANYTVKINNGNSHIEKAKLTINVGDASTTYGTAFDESKYGYVLSGLVNGDSDGALRNEIGGVGYTNDAALDGSNGKWTANAGDYENAVGIDSIDSLANYTIKINNGNATVNKASLTVNANDASAVYGSDSWNYGYKLDGLANGDTAEGLSEELSGIKYDNTAAFDGTNGRYTADSRRYEGAISINLTGVDLKNYEVNAGNKGTATVTPAKLTITADDQSVLLGTRPEYTGTAPADLGNQLVNGDSLDGFSYIFGIADTGLETEIGRHEGVIGLFAGGHFYGGGTHDLSTLSSVFHNYDVTVDAGTLTVSAGDNFGHLHWLHRGGERVRNFRERKAGLHFVDGGMIYEEDM